MFFMCDKILLTYSKLPHETDEQIIILLTFKINENEKSIDTESNCINAYTVSQYWTKMKKNLDPVFIS